MKANLFTPTFFQFIVKRLGLASTLILVSLITPGCANLNLALGLDDDDNSNQQVSDSQEGGIFYDPMSSIAMKLRKPKPMSAVGRMAQREAEQDQESAAMRHGEIIPGMPMASVRSLWGDPVEVQFAGKPGLGHEKWTYFYGLSSNWGMGTSRDVYFEDGRVVGWETHSR